MTYRVPNPEAPYPQDFIIDQQSNIAYWSDEYDPQEIMRVIDRLLGTSVEESENPNSKSQIPKLNIIPNPTRDAVRITWQISNSKFQTFEITIYDASGAFIKEFNLNSESLNLKSLIWSGIDHTGQPVSSGIYFARLTIEGGVTTQSFIITR